MSVKDSPAVLSPEGSNDHNVHHVILDILFTVQDIPRLKNKRDKSTPLQTTTHTPQDSKQHSPNNHQNTQAIPKTLTMLSSLPDEEDSLPSSYWTSPSPPSPFNHSHYYLCTDRFWICDHRRTMSCHSLRSHHHRVLRHHHPSSLLTQPLLLFLILVPTILLSPSFITLASSCQGPNDEPIGGEILFHCIPNSQLTNVEFFPCLLNAPYHR